MQGQKQVQETSQIQMKSQKEHSTVLRCILETQSNITIGLSHSS